MGMRTVAAFVVLACLAGCSAADGTARQTSATAQATGGTCGEPPVLPEALAPGRPLKPANAKDYEGLTLTEAQLLAERQGEVLQQVGADGECFVGPFPANVQYNRANVYTEDRIVRDAYTG